MKKTNKIRRPIEETLAQKLCKPFNLTDERMDEFARFKTWQQVLITRKAIEKR